MKKSVLVVVSFVIILLTVATVSAGSVEPRFTKNVCKNPTDGYITFENGVDGAVVSSSIPGVVFSNTGGLDWQYIDFRNPIYNQNYARDGNFAAWLGVTGTDGKITFTGDPATYVSALVAVGDQSDVSMQAYDVNGNQVDDSGLAGSNYGTGTMTRLTVEAPAISYVIIHDTGNFWEVDDICTDATGIPPVPEFPTAFLPAAFVIGFLGVVLIIRTTHKN